MFPNFFLQKPKRRTQITSHTGRSSVPDNAQGRSSRSMSFSPDRVRVRGRSPAFNALAANFEKPDRNLSTPPPVVRKLQPRSLSPDPSKIQPPPKAAAIAALSSSFEKPPTQNLIPRVVKGTYAYTLLRNITSPFLNGK